MRKYLTEEEFNKLLSQIAKGKKRALETFYAIYGKLIYSAAYSICQDAEIANEVVNDVLVKVWNVASHIKVKRPEGWLYVIAVNAAKSALRPKDLPLNDKSIRVAAKDSLEEVLSLDSFFSIISPLSEEEKEIFTYRFVQDMKLKDIAEMMGMSKNTLASKLRRALQKLKQKIKRKF